MKDSRGFAALFVLALLPVGLVLLIALGASIELLQTDLKMKQICRREGLRTMTQASWDLQKLLKMNPRALLLRMQYRQKQIALAAAMARADAATVALLQARLLKIQEQRRVLDIAQKSLLRKSNLQLDLARRSIHSHLKQTLLNSPLLIFRLSSTDVRSMKTLLAVHPKDSDLAPEYVTPPQFQRAQALALHWQYTVHVRTPFSFFLKHSARFHKNCAVSLTEEKWSPQIVEVRPSSNSAW